MPHKHIVKTYVAEGHYHVYNRGVEKRVIFLDDQDYRVFLHLLKHYLSPFKQDAGHPLSEIPDHTIVRPRPLSSLSEEVDLLAYCLMPNHFHLLIKQLTPDGMPKLLQRVSTTYSMYFNKRHDRVGHLFQGAYKAALITEDEYLLHLSRYIHLNPAELTGLDLVSYPYSSYPYYLDAKKAEWVKPEFILDSLKSYQGHPESKKFSSYREFVEVFQEDPQKTIGALGID